VKLAQKGTVLVNTTCIYTVLEGPCTQTIRTNEWNINEWNPRGKPNQCEALAQPQNSIKITVLNKIMVKSPFPGRNIIWNEKCEAYR